MNGTPHLDKIVALAQVRGYEREVRGREEFVHGFSRAGEKAFGDLSPGDYVHMPDDRIYRVAGHPALLGEGTRQFGRRISVSVTHNLLGHRLEHVRSGKVMQAAALSYHQVKTVQPSAGLRRILPGVNENMTPPDEKNKFILGVAGQRAGDVADEMDRRLR